jgi:hypothetical protein
MDQRVRWAIDLDQLQTTNYDLDWRTNKLWRDLRNATCIGERPIRTTDIYASRRMSCSMIESFQKNQNKRRSRDEQKY